MIEQILIYSLAGLFVYVTASMFVYKEEVEVRKKQILFKDEQIEYLRDKLKEVVEHNG